MTDIEQKALALWNEVCFERKLRRYVSLGRTGDTKAEALCRAIERHEAFRQEVSDAVEGFMLAFSNGADSLPSISRFIIPKPKPDPLIEVLRSVGGDDRDYCDYDIYVKEIRAALKARGLEIVEVKNDDRH